MPVFAHRPNTALLVLDTRDTEGRAPGTARPASAFDGLVARARAAKVPVVWVRRTRAARRNAPFGPRACEPVVGTRRGDPFKGTVLEAVLSAHTVGHLVVAGTRGDARMRSTLHGAFVRGYDVTLVGAGAQARSAAFVDAEMIEFA